MKYAAAVLALGLALQATPALAQVYYGPVTTYYAPRVPVTTYYAPATTYYSTYYPTYYSAYYPTNYSTYYAPASAYYYPGTYYTVPRWVARRWYRNGFYYW